MNDKKIPSWLENVSYEKLFLQGEAAHLLSCSGLESELSELLATRGLEPRLRVLVHELLVDAGEPIRPELVESYCQMLPAGFLHNWWGMPGQYLERLGRTMVEFGELAIPCLVRLLDDRQMLGYFGSEEPTLSQEMKYRVCDLAAYLITIIIGVPYQDAKQPEERDRFSAELRRILNRKLSNATCI
jgi:hypothetical protein